MSKYTITLTPRSKGLTALKADVKQFIRFYKGRRKLAHHYGWAETRRASFGMIWRRRFR